MRKGYSLIMWTATLIAVVGALVMLRISFRRALAGKIQATSDYVLFSQWQQEPQEFLEENEPDKTSRSRAKSSETQILQVITQHNSRIQNKRDDTTDVLSVSSAVGKGSEALLNSFELEPEHVNP